jgi:hypothetical protein
MGIAMEREGSALAARNRVFEKTLVWLRVRQASRTEVRRKTA